jgi:hypothetical protein
MGRVDYKIVPANGQLNIDVTNRVAIFCFDFGGNAVNIRV